MKNIIISGMGHTGTRMLVDFFSQFDEIYVPKIYLNSVNEFEKLHKFFIKSMDNISFKSDEYFLNKKELFEILDEYYSLNKKKITVLKMPFYSLVFNEYLNEYFDNNYTIINSLKSFKSIYNSFEKRNEVDLFMNNSEEMIRQLKKVNASFRLNYLDKQKKNKKKIFFYKYFLTTNNLIKNLNNKNYLVNCENKKNFKNDMIKFLVKELPEIQFTDKSFFLFGDDKKKINFRKFLSKLKKIIERRFNIQIKKIH